MRAVDRDTTLRQIGDAFFSDSVLVTYIDSMNHVNGTHKCHP